MKKSSQPPKFTLFYSNFIGEYVSMVTKMTSKREITVEEGSESDEGPMVLEGYLLDEDKSYYYLGEHPDNVNQAVKKNMVAHISILEPRTIYDEILDDFPNPKHAKDIN